MIESWSTLGHVQHAVNNPWRARFFYGKPPPRPQSAAAMPSSSRSSTSEARALRRRRWLGTHCRNLCGETAEVKICCTRGRIPLLPKVRPKILFSSPNPIPPLPKYWIFPPNRTLGHCSTTAMPEDDRPSPPPPAANGRQWRWSSGDNGERWPQNRGFPAERQPEIVLEGLGRELGRWVSLWYEGFGIHEVLWSDLAVENEWKGRGGWGSFI